MRKRFSDAYVYVNINEIKFFWGEIYAPLIKKLRASFWNTGISADSPIVWRTGLYRSLYIAQYSVRVGEREIVLEIPFRRPPKDERMKFAEIFSYKFFEELAGYFTFSKSLGEVRARKFVHRRRLLHGSKVSYVAIDIEPPQINVPENLETIALNEYVGNISITSLSRYSAYIERVERAENYARAVVRLEDPEIFLEYELLCEKDRSLIVLPADELAFYSYVFFESDLVHSACPQAITLMKKRMGRSVPSFEN